MRVVLDTNILISALIRPKSEARQMYEAAKSGRIALVTCDAQFEEFRRVTRYPKVQRYISPAEAGTMLNEIRELALYFVVNEKLDVSPDPADNYLFALAQSSEANYLVTGDKDDVLAIGKHGKTKIVSLKKLMEILKLKK